MRGLAQKNALVTGAAKGIGRGIAERLEQGCASGRFGYGINNEMKKSAGVEECWQIFSILLRLLILLVDDKMMIGMWLDIV